MDLTCALGVQSRTLEILPPSLEGQDFPEMRGG